MIQAPLIRRGLLLEYLTLGWNVVGLVIGVAAAYMARSMALAGFGLDSLIEIFASVIDAYLAGAVLIGLILNALFDWWWADPLASLVIVYYGIREGMHAWRSEGEQHA